MELKLSESRAFKALLGLDAGDLTPEARSVAILYATDRMEIARGLPKHLKVYAVEGAFSALFGVPPPEVRSVGSKSMKGGAWLSYVTTAANAAGHSCVSRNQSHSRSPMRLRRE